MLSLQLRPFCPECNSEDIEVLRDADEFLVCECKRCSSDDHPTVFFSLRDRSLSAVMAPSQWAGERVVIVGGGASAKGYDLSAKVECGYKSISIGWSWVFFQDRGLIPSIAISTDPAFWRGIFNSRSADRFIHSTFLRASTWAGAHQEHVHVIGTSRDWSRGLKRVICRGNSGLTALNLADILGAKEVILVGFDLDGTDRQGVKSKARFAAHKRFVGDFRDASKMVRCPVKVANAASPLCDFWGAA